MDGERLQLLRRNQILLINSALVTDTSSYKCTATNRVGDASKYFDLNVYGEIKLNSQLALVRLHINHGLQGFVNQQNQNVV